MAPRASARGARPERRGKACALDDAAALANHEVLVFCDTRQWIEPQALRMRGYGVYWRYETFLRRCESEIDSLLGATGALYAIRRELFESIPGDTLDDDLAIPCHALRRGGRIVFEPRARAIDEAPTQAGHEFGRKVRTLAGCFQLFGRERWLFDPRKNPIWLQTMSHKGLRLLGPFCMIAAFVATLALADELLYTTALVGQIMFYGAAVVGLAAPRFARRVLAVPPTFVLLQAAVVVGLVRLLTGSPAGDLEDLAPRTPRSARESRASR